MKRPQPLTSESYSTAAEVWARAFEDDPAPLAILKGYAVEERLRALTVAFGANLRHCAPQAVPLAIHNETELAGAALIHRPGKFPPPMTAQLHVFWEGFKAVRSLSIMWRWGSFLSTLEKHHPKEPHFYLETLGVDPQWQGLGFGSCLMEQLNKWMDDEGVGGYLETTKPRNVPFHQRHGFEITKEIDVIGVHAWLMWRPPTKAKM